MTSKTWHLEPTTLLAVATLSAALLNACTKEGAATTAPPPPARSPSPAIIETDDLESSQGPDLSGFSKELAAKGEREPREVMQPFTSAAFLAPTGKRPVLGLVQFADTTMGLRVVASVEGLDPGGIYELRADEFTHGGVEGVTCETAPEPTKSSQPVVWRLGPLKADGAGVARFDRIYSGIGNASGPYVVRTRVGRGSKVPRTTIDLRRFFLPGRKLTVHRRTGGSKTLGEALACSIIHDAPPFGEAVIAPAAGMSAKGTVAFQQGEDNRATMEVKLTNLAPGAYRLVVHEFADCANATATGVGGLYKPEDNPVVTQPDYGWPLKQGELGSFTADAAGTLSAEKVFEHPLTSGGPHTIRGRAIVVEAANEKSPVAKTTRVGCGMVTAF